MVGLSVDLGYTFAERRSVQNAADAAAMAGAHALTKWSTSNSMVAADADVSTVVAGNKMNNSTTQTYSCEYVDDNGTDLGPCTAAVPTTPIAATGVQVVVHETHNTFFIRVLPGGPKTVSTSASATAHVQGITTEVGSDGPFIACGVDSSLAAGGTMSILNTSTSEAAPNDLTASTLNFPVSSASQYTVQLMKKPTPTPTPVPTPSPTPTATSNINCDRDVDWRRRR